jgi:NAD(P)-dependent dehydrogenase (short-subunit alcohol dehydrogenase family)
METAYKGVEGQRVLVTAGASGIGRAIADMLIGHGARLHICDIEDRFLAEFAAAHPRVGVTRADVASEADVDRLFDEAAAGLGGLDVLVNNAGVAGPTGKIEDLDPADWRRCIDVDLTGSFLCARKAVPMLKAAGGGSIVNISSVAGKFGYPFRTPYASAKYGIVGLSETLARELGPSNIRVNAVQPGLVKGPRIAAVIAARATETGQTYEEAEAGYLDNVSMHRMVTAGEIAAMILFLLSDAGSSISGQSIAIDCNTEKL